MEGNGNARTQGSALNPQAAVQQNGSVTMLGAQLGAATATNGVWNGYQYTYPYQSQVYYPDYSLTGRVASLEGEVKVLREMVAALLSGRAPKASAKR